MAKTLRTFDWENNQSGAHAKYDWKNWLNGKVWEIRRGQDYDISTKSMSTSLHVKADTRGMKVHTRKIRNEDEGWEGLIFQFVPRD